MSKNTLEGDSLQLLEYYQIDKFEEGKEYDSTFEIQLSGFENVVIQQPENGSLDYNKSRNFGLSFELRPDGVLTVRAKNIRVDDFFSFNVVAQVYGIAEVTTTLGAYVFTKKGWKHLLSNNHKLIDILKD
jgi:hypothetical protein